MLLFAAAYSLLLLSTTRERAESEMRAPLEWLVQLLPSRVGTQEHPDVPSLVRLVHGLDEVRHVSVRLVAADGTLLATTAARPGSLPPWLAQGTSSSQAVRKTITDGARAVGYFEVLSNPRDEIAELWDEYLRSISVMLSLAFVAVVLIVVLTFRLLQPLARVHAALRRVEAGRPGGQLPTTGTTEFDNFVRSFNRMSVSLDAARAQSTSLMHTLIEHDEHTRRSLAHDLHNDLSPYMVSLPPLTRSMQRLCNGRADRAELLALLETMDHHQSQMLGMLRRILAGLHPLELETLGLRESLQQLAPRALDAQGLQAVLHLEGDWSSFGPTLDVSVYRIVQECIADAMRHASGSRLAIVVRPVHLPEGRQIIEIEATNDAAIIPQAPSRGGKGLLGMRDRCTALGGTFESGPNGTHGWRVLARLPLTEFPSVAPPHASR